MTVSRHIKSPRWSPDEDTVLRRLWIATPWATLLAAFPGRSKQAIKMRASVLGIGRRINEWPDGFREEQRLRIERRWNEQGFHRAITRPIIVVDGVAGKVCRDCRAWTPLSKLIPGKKHSGGRAGLCHRCAHGRYGSGNYKRNRARIIARVLHWQRRNKFSVSAYKAKTAASRRVAIGTDTITGEQLRDVFDAFEGLCAYCSAPADTMDHATPLSRGGRHVVENILPACRSCNSRKHTKTLDEYQGQLLMEHAAKAA